MKALLQAPDDKLSQEANVSTKNSGLFWLFGEICAQERLWSLRLDWGSVDISQWTDRYSITLWWFTVPFSFLEFLSCECCDVHQVFPTSSCKWHRSTQTALQKVCVVPDSRKYQSGGQGLGNNQGWPLFFLYFDNSTLLFKIKQWPSLFRPNCSEAIQWLKSLPMCQVCTCGSFRAQGPTKSAPKQWKSEVHLQSWSCNLS